MWNVRAASFGLSAERIIRVNRMPNTPGIHSGSKKVRFARLFHHATTNLYGISVLYALTDILAGQEVEVDYTLWDGQTDQRDILEQKFGFLCTCPSCSRPLDERRRSAERIRDYLKFVASFLKQLRTAPSPAALLLRLEQMTLLACEEGREWDVGARCYNGFQLCAYYGDLDASRQWAAAHRDAYILRRGSDCERAQKGAELARDPTQWSGWAQLGRRKLRGPVSIIRPSSCEWLELTLATVRYPQQDSSPRLHPLATGACLNWRRHCCPRSCKCRVNQRAEKESAGEKKKSCSNY